MSENGDHERPQRQHGGGGGGGRRQRGSSDEKELASQQIQIQSKRFYIDVKENQRGRFIKLAEVGVGGRKSRIIMALAAAAEFKSFLAEFSEIHAQMGPPAAAAGNAAEPPSPVTNGGEGGGDQDSSTSKKDSDNLIKSVTIAKDRKRYYLDLKENQRGRFLKVSMILNRGGNRSQIAIPAQGLVEFRDQLTDLLDRYAATDESLNAGSQQTGQTAAADLPESKSFRADNKTFYFDCGANARGVYVKISEVRLNRYRTSITIPDKFLQQFQESLSEFAEKTKAISLATAADADDSSSTPPPETASTTSKQPIQSDVSKVATAIANGTKD